MRKKTLKQNAFILTISGFVVKMIGFVYRIHIANSIGAEGMGLFQLVLPVYNLILLGLTAGVGIAVSRLVAAETAKGNHRSAVRIAVVSGAAIFTAATVVVVILFFNLDFVVNILVGDIRTKSALYYLLPSIPIVAGITSFRGYFYGKQEMTPNAISQVIEQFTKLFVIYALADLFAQGDLERKCLYATLGMISGELAQAIAVYISFQLHKKPKTTEPSEILIPKRYIGRSILRISLPITANRLILSLLGTVEFLWIPKRLGVYGLTSAQALAEYGKLTGMASPVISFPSMLTAALATALVPAIAEAAAMNKMSGANRQISRSIRITLVMGFLFSSLFICFSSDISKLIYPGQDVGRMLFLLSFSAVFFYLQQTLIGILNGLGKEVTTLKHSMITSVLRLAFVWFAIPYFGMSAYIAALIFSNFLGSILNLRTTINTTGVAVNLGDWLIKPLITAACGVIIAPVVKMLAGFATRQPTAELLLSVSLTAGLMIIMLVLMGVFELKDIRQMIPFHIDKYRKL